MSTAPTPPTPAETARVPARTARRLEPIHITEPNAKTAPICVGPKPSRSSTSGTTSPTTPVSVPTSAIITTAPRRTGSRVTARGGGAQLRGVGRADVGPAHEDEAERDDGGARRP